MAILRRLEVDPVLSGHHHVRHVWSIAEVRVVHSGTVSTLRVHGTMPPSYNVIESDADDVRNAMRQPGQGVQGEEPLARFARVPVTTGEFYPALVRYDADPFATPSHQARAGSATAHSMGEATAARERPAR